jgi:P27 family predicted phage terminase small subunit
MPTGRKPKLTLISDRVPHRSNQDIEARREAEPKGCEANFRAPRELSAEAKKEWRRIIRLYKQLEVPILNDLDQCVLAAYCESTAIYRTAQIAYAKNPSPIGKDADGRWIENPLVAIMDKQGKNIARYAEQLCLSPVGRARMGLAKSKAATDDPMEEILNRQMMRNVLE